MSGSVLKNDRALTRHEQSGFYVQQQDDGQWAAISPDGEQVMSSWPSESEALRALQLDRVESKFWAGKI